MLPPAFLANCNQLSAATRLRSLALSADRHAGPPKCGG